jgi:hypothetical protein
MRTKTFLVVCLFLGLGFTQLSAQNGKNGTGTVTGINYFDYMEWPVYCNGEQVDNLVGTITYHYETYFKIGIEMWSHSRGSGEAVSTWKVPPEGGAEVFNINEIDKKFIPGEQYTIIKWNIVGNKGSHYIGTLLMDNETWELISVKAVCAGVNK